MRGEDDVGEHRAEYVGGRLQHDGGDLIEREFDHSDPVGDAGADHR